MEKLSTIQVLMMRNYAKVDQIRLIWSTFGANLFELVKFRDQPQSTVDFYF